MRREHVVTFIVLAWSGSARASDEDVAIARASTDLKCDELQMMHSKNEYAFVGCGKRRVYECAASQCEDVTNRKSDVPMPSAGCVAAITVDVALVGCACISLASRSPSAVPILPITKDACAAK
jgi:hypothetical protein